jgi:hypothetical protein
MDWWYTTEIHNYGKSDGEGSKTGAQKSQPRGG